MTVKDRQLWWFEAWCADVSGRQMESCRSPTEAEAAAAVQTPDSCLSLFPSLSLFVSLYLPFCNCEISDFMHHRHGDQFSPISLSYFHFLYFFPSFFNLREKNCKFPVWLFCCLVLYLDHKPHLWRILSDFSLSLSLSLFFSSGFASSFSHSPSFLHCCFHLVTCLSFIILQLVLVL